MYILIVNPESGSGKALQLLKNIQQDRYFQQKNCRSFITKYAGHAEEIAEQTAEIYKGVIQGVLVVGGDGTLHEVMNGLQWYPLVPVAFIPTGSGNDFHRGIHNIHKEIALFRKIVQDPTVHNLRFGAYLVNHKRPLHKRLFVNSIGFGLDGSIVTTACQLKKNIWLRRMHLLSLTYLLSFFKVLPKYKPIHFELELDGKPVLIKEAALLTITNHPYYGRGMKIAPTADLNSSSFKVILITPMAKWKMFLLFFSVFIGKHTKLKEVYELDAESVVIRSDSSIPFQVDGEAGRCFHCRIEKSDSYYKVLSG